MSSLAQIMFDLGYDVQGSDKEQHFFTQIALEERGIKLLPYNDSNIDDNIIAVVGASIKGDNVELQKANKLNVKKYAYFELLGKLTRKYNTIAVCGCHGKTSTTSLLAHVFNNIVGSNYLIGDGTGFANKNNSYFMIEACEYRRHFLYYYPKTTIITNIDLDHIDYFKDLDDIKDAFISFANQTEKQIIACGDNLNIRSIKDKINKPIYFYGIEDNNDFKATNIVSSNKGFTFDVYFKDELVGTFNIDMYGKHSILNALAVIAAAYLDNLDMESVKKHLRTYNGAKRRFSETVIDDIVIIDDYAHHPNEMRAVIEAAKQKYPDKEIIGVFLPHTFSRTKALYKEIAQILNTINKSYVLDVYPSREKASDYPGITNDLIIDLLKNGESIKRDNIDKLLNHHDSVIIFMSPDDLNDMIDKYVNLLKQNKEH
ncbi:MAG TPA: UDP-N-acetylmuramate--L-alanine ligase [Mollicutes bacterium]|nr:UDP-N-acetylmuramate--L-alanine ligase [Mollicutes bacterium]